MWCQEWDPVTMTQQPSMQSRPARMMTYLERSMIKVDQMMEQLRASMGQARGADQGPFSLYVSTQAAAGLIADSHMAGAQQVRFSSTPREKKRQRPTAGTGVRFTPPHFSSHIHDVGSTNDALIDRRPHLVPDRFDGCTPVEDYLHHFEACAGVNRWTKIEAVQFLAASLRGPAVKLLSQQPGVELTYDELVYRLRKRFGLGGKADVYLAELKQRRRQPKESLQELGQKIRELCAMSYPEFDEKGQDRLARGHFLDAIVTPEIREGVFRAQPRTLDDAVEAALNTEAFLRMEGQRNEVKRSSKYSWAPEECEVAAIQEQQPRSPIIDEITMAVLVALERRDKKNSTKTKSDAEEGPGKRPEQTVPAMVSHQEENPCFNCNKLGHWKKNCPYSKKAKGGTTPPPASVPEDSVTGRKAAQDELPENPTELQSGLTVTTSGLLEDEDALPAWVFSQTEEQRTCMEDIPIPSQSPEVAEVLDNTEVFPTSTSDLDQTTLMHHCSDTINAEPRRPDQREHGITSVNAPRCKSSSAAQIGRVDLPNHSRPPDQTDSSLPSRFWSPHRTGRVDLPLHTRPPDGTDSSHHSCFRSQKRTTSRPSRSSRRRSGAEKRSPRPERSRSPLHRNAASSNHIQSESPHRTRIWKSDDMQDSSENQSKLLQKMTVEQ